MTPGQAVDVDKARATAASMPDATSSVCAGDSGAQRVGVELGAQQRPVDPLLLGQVAGAVSPAGANAAPASRPTAATSKSTPARSCSSPSVRSGVNRRWIEVAPPSRSSRIAALVAATSTA